MSTLYEQCSCYLWVGAGVADIVLRLIMRCVHNRSCCGGRNYSYTDSIRHAVQCTTVETWNNLHSTAAGGRWSRPARIILVTGAGIK